jgi:hypothetical protein
MRLLLALAAAGALAVHTPLAAGQSRPYAVYTSTSSWLRAGPAPNARAVALLPQSTLVRVGYCEAGWCTAQFRRFSGYVQARELTLGPRLEAVDPGRGYVNVRGQWIPSPSWTASGRPPEGATAQCVDRSFSFSQSRSGTCSHHGGVARWL